MKPISKLLLATVAITCVTSQSRAQDLGGTLQGVGAAYAEAYVQPLVNAFGADINSGLFHTAQIGGGMLPVVDLYLGVKVFGAFVPIGDRTLDLSYTAPRAFTGADGELYTVDVVYDIEDAPTIFGDTESPGVVIATVNETVDAGMDGQMGTADDIVINEQSELDLAPGLIKTSIAPLAIPQARIGSVFGTDMMIRYLPRVDRDDLGSFGFIGLGVRHSVSQYVPMLPMNLAAQISWQKLGIQDADDTEVLTANMWAMSVMASKSFFVASVYGGLQLESASVDLDYTFVDPQGELPDQRVSFSMDGRNRVRMVAGVGLNMGPVVMNVDYSLGSINVVSAGLGISL